MAISETMSFARSGQSVTLPSPQPATIQSSTNVVQASVSAADGTTFVDDKGVTLYTIQFTVVMTEAQAKSFVTWYRDVAKRALNTFTWVDHTGKSWNGCRFGASQECLFTKSSGKRYSLDVVLEVPSAFAS